MKVADLIKKYFTKSNKQAARAQRQKRTLKPTEVRAIEYYGKAAFQLGELFPEDQPSQGFTVNDAAPREAKKF